VNFSKSSYQEMLNTIGENSFVISIERPRDSKWLLLRHDIDFDLNLSLSMARLESANSISSIYLPLVSSPFYDIREKNNQKVVLDILEMGHQLGLHYDASIEPKLSLRDQVEILEQITGIEVSFVSHHNPTLNGFKSFPKEPKIKDLNLHTPFSTLKYLSDSCMSPREDIFSCLKIESSIQLLIHPEFWVLEVQNLRQFRDILLNIKPSTMRQIIVEHVELMEFTIRNRKILDNNKVLKPRKV
jgi:hypothetical protein